MGFFESLGKMTEVTKRKFTDGNYECFSCKQRLSGEHETCPHCGSTDIGSVGDRHRILGMIHIEE
jgi:predicted RNA-binding Zn-ribbon protein involved in translation (DUF1610 family)